MKTLVFDITSHVPLFVTLYLREKEEREKHMRSPASSHFMAAPFMTCDTVTLIYFGFVETVVFTGRAWVYVF